MWLIALIRVVIFVTFVLLVGEGITAIIVIYRFHAAYVKRHVVLQMRVAAVERRLDLLEQAVAL